MKKKIRVLRKKPGRPPEFIEIENELAALQHEVGGYIETFGIASNLTIVCNEEGKIHGLPYNCTIFGETFVGPILLVGVRGDTFKSVPLAEMGDVRLLLPTLFYDEEAEA